MLDQRRRRGHVDHFGTARIAHGACTTNHQDAALVDLQLRIVDPRVIVLRSFEHDSPCLEAVFCTGFGQVGLAKRLTDHRHFHDRAIEEVTAEHDEPGTVFERGFEGIDHVGVIGQAVADDFADGLAADRGAVFVQAPGFLQFMHDRWHAARAMETFAQVFAGRHAIDQQRHIFANPLPVIQAQLDTHVSGDGDQVRRAVA
ncbi:hypothetical protein D3C84_469400 [compost metagenome]